MTLWAESFETVSERVNVQIEGKGSTHPRHGAPVEGTAQIGPMSRPMKAEEIDAFEKNSATSRPRSKSPSMRSPCLPTR
ncbi:MAG: hypothetical protein R3F11_21610 [Verrucomicrobiales bacterium]